MENLPADIEQKIEQLPYLDFELNDEFQNLIFSDLFSDIFNFYKENYLPDTLKTKSEVYQRISLYLNLTGQGDKFTEETDKLLWRRPCPDIHTFLTDKFYMGYNNSTLYPYWREKLEDMFKDSSPVRKAIFSGCIGCLTDDTIIATLNGEKTIKELLNNFENEWVLSYNTSNNSWEPDKIIDVFYTGNRNIYEIELDNGEKIKCTSNHKFLTRKNKWVSIDNGLTPGLSMMPYYTRISRTGYTQVKNNQTEKFENRYQIIGKWKTHCQKGLDIHHKNFNKLDDRPFNLTIIPHRLHWEYHAKLGAIKWKEYNQSISGDEFKEYRRNKALKGRVTYRNRLDYKEKEKIRTQKWHKLLQDTEHQKKASYSVWHGKNAEKNKIKASETLSARNKTEKARETSKKMAENMRNLKANKTPEELKIIFAKQRLATIKRWKGENSLEYINLLSFIKKAEPWYNPLLEAKENYRLKQKYNHKIKSITYIGKENVYDITTEKNHNFALKAGIVAHNSGKSTIARKAFVYVLYRLLCLRYPRSVLNIDQDATIANVVIATTLKQVYEVNILPFIKLMETMPCFQRVMSQRSFENFNLEDPHCPLPFYFEKSSGTIHFPDNIILTSGSQPTHFTGMNVINSFCDEINDYGNIEDTIALLNTLDNRFSSRFSGIDLVFQSVVSSARTTNSALGEYVSHLPQNDPSILKLNPMLWEVKPDPDFKGDGTTFPVMVGNGSIPSKIITDPGEIKAIEEGNYEPPVGCILINVPTVYRSKFELQLDQSIQDIAGMTTSDNNMVFRDVSRLEDSVLNPEFRIEANIHDNTDILALLEPYDLFEQTLSNRWQFKRAPSALRYCHIDLSSGGDNGQCDTGICILHKEWKQNEVTGEKEIVFVVDLLIAINAKNKVDLRSVQNFLTDLVLEKNIPIHTVSADQYQSTTMLQAFETSGCFSKVDKLSVDIKLEPYTNTATLIETGHVKVGKCPTLKKELTALVLQKGKVTRTTELKDLADVLVGAIWNAQLNYSDYPQYQYFSGKNIIKTINYLDLIDPETEELADI